MIPRVVDLSHHNAVSNFHETAKAGIWGIIHKSSEGIGFVDPRYAPRRKPALDAGLLWGAYHFNNNTPVAQQVDHFLKTAAPDDTTLMVLDYEDNAKGNMSIQQAVEFLHLLEQKLGRRGAIYSGNRLKETIRALGPADRAYIAGHRLWLAEYGPKAVLPFGFSSWWLWQYTGDGVGPEPHGVAGIVGNVLDLNAYVGASQAQLAKEWAPAAGAIATSSSPQPAKPANQETTMATPVATSVQASPAAAPASDPIPAIIRYIDVFQNFFLPGIAKLVPLPYRPIVQAAPAVLEEVLQGVEDAKTKSGGDLAQSLLTRIENLVSHGKQITTNVSGAQPVAATPAKPIASGSSGGMPNSGGDV